MKPQSALAAFYAFLAVFFTLLAVGLPQWCQKSGYQTIGLWGETDQTGDFHSWAYLLSQNPGSLTLSNWQLAGQVGAAFLLIGSVSLAVATVCMVMRAFKESIPIPAEHNNPRNSALFSSLGLYGAVFGTFFVWFGWALWASLRVYGDSGNPGWCILFVVLGFVFGALSSLLFSIERSGEYAPLLDAGHGNSELHRDWSTPPYRTSLKSFLYYHQWDAPALTRVLFHLSLLVFLIYYLDYTTSFDVASSRDLWIRIVIGVIYLAVAAVVSRIVCELVLAIFVAKDHFVGKRVAREAPHHHHHEHHAEHHQHNGSNEPVAAVVAAPSAAPAASGGGYQAL